MPNGNNTTISRWFNGKDGHRQIAKDWLYTYTTTPMGQLEELLHPGDLVRVYIADRKACLLALPHSYQGARGPHRHTTSRHLLD